MKKNILGYITAVMITILLVFSGCSTETQPATREEVKTENAETPKEKVKYIEKDQAREEIESLLEKPVNEINSAIFTPPLVDIESIPAYSGNPYVEMNGNKPYFPETDYSEVSFERYSALDSKGRCGVAVANVGKDLMPTKERESIGSVTPTGWHKVKYESINADSLYSRCHLIGFQLAGENANEKNLITGTNYMNSQGMNPFENSVANYVKSTGNHVLLRVTPVFKGDNLLADGVLMEARSMEDKGAGICFNIFCYNVQPGIIIDYATGESSQEIIVEPVEEIEEVPEVRPQKVSYIGNKNTKKFHYPSCKSVKQMKGKNKVELNCTRQEAIDMGYEPCKNCYP